MLWKNLYSEDMIRRFLIKFLNDGTYKLLLEKLEAQADEIQAGRIKSIPLEELRNRYDKKIRSKGL